SPCRQWPEFDIQYAVDQRLDVLLFAGHVRPELERVAGNSGSVEFARWTTRHRLVEALRISSVRIRAFPLEADGEPRRHTGCATIARRTIRTAAARCDSWWRRSRHGLNYVVLVRVIQLHWKPPKRPSHLMNQ